MVLPRTAGYALIKKMDYVRRKILVASALSAGLSGCALDANTDHDSPTAPRAREANDPIIAASWALVLSSGGPRGFVHVGVIKALDELKLKPPMVVGASVGALVGALWAAGLPALEIERLAIELSPLQVLRVAVGSAQRFSGAAIANLVNYYVGERMLEGFPTRFIPVAALASNRTPIIFDAGDAGLAVQASAAIEGTFAPVRIRGVTYIDPDLVAPMPVRVAKACGAGKVLSVDASAHENSAPPGAEYFRELDARKRALTAPDALLAELNLHPRFGYYVNLTEAFRRRAIEAGYKETLANADKIRALVAA
jgi:NTE family protein